MLKLGCGTALPSLAMFQWAIQEGVSPSHHHHFAVADYNPTVLQLVTLPNFILSWAILQKTHIPALETAFMSDDELELTPEVLQAFQDFLVSRNITLAFLSGAWSPELVAMIYDGLHADVAAPTSTLLLGAETIYSPFALAAFTEMNFSILEREKKRTGTRRTAAYIAAKRLYFGVGGSLDDFIDGARQRGGVVDTLREETDGVRRGVVRCTIT
jgi:protein-histidine N-methyltransferase